ncbi:MAG: hypothetical protein HOP08_18655 [Cyclobacteriaceae bacterium]|nr:hypothetical protein [Cyclobacteriaceae bacterium]
MKTLIKVSCVILFLSFGSCRTMKVPSDTELKTNYAKVQDILKGIQLAICEAYNAEGYSGADNALNFLEEVEVSLANGVSREVGGEVSFWVIKAGGSRGRERTTTFTFNFEPNKSKSLLTSADYGNLKSTNRDLVKALKSLGTCIKEYQSPDYNLNEIDLEVALVISTKGTAGAEFKIGVVGIGPSLEVGSTKGNTITLKLKLPKPTAKP